MHKIIFTTSQIIESWTIHFILSSKKLDASKIICFNFFHYCHLYQWAKPHYIHTVKCKKIPRSGTHFYVFLLITVRDSTPRKLWFAHVIELEYLEVTLLWELWCEDNPQCATYPAHCFYVEGGGGLIKNLTSSLKVDV